MEINKLLKNGSLLAAVGLLALLPMTSMAAVPSNCASTAAATALVDTSQLLNGMWKDAEQLARQSDALQYLADHPTTHKRIQTDELTGIRMTVSDMENRLCRLEAIQASLPSAEQHAIFEASPLVRSIASDINAAIGDHLASIAYCGYMQVLNAQAEELANDIDLGEHVAALHQRSPEYQ